MFACVDVSYLIVALVCVLDLFSLVFGLVFALILFEFR